MAADRDAYPRLMSQKDLRNLSLGLLTAESPLPVLHLCRVSSLLLLLLSLL